MKLGKGINVGIAVVEIEDEAEIHLVVVGVIEEGATGVPELADLLLDGGFDRRRPMSQIVDGDAAGEVEIAVAVNIGDPGSLAVDDFDFVFEGDYRGDAVA